MIARVRYRDVEVNLIFLLFIEGEDGNDIRVDSIARLDVNGDKHMVTFNGEDHFEEGTHGQIWF